MKGSYKGRGIVLHTLKYGESKLIVHMLTSIGRVSYMVQGIRGKRGNKSALFQPLFAVEFEAIYPSRGELHMFKEVRSGLILRRTPFELRHSTISLFIAELLYKLTKDGESNEALFDFVWGAVEQLDMLEDNMSVANFHLWFLSKLMIYMGFAPAGICGRGYLLDIAEGEFTTHNPQHINIIEPSEAGVIYSLIEVDNPLQLSDIALNRELRGRVLSDLVRYYNYHLDTINEVRSIEILKELF